MSNWNPNSAKHKAGHGGYRDKPTKSELKANFDFWGIDFAAKGTKSQSVEMVIANPGFGTPKIGTQLKLNF